MSEKSAFDQESAGRVAPQTTLKNNSNVTLVSTNLTYNADTTEFSTNDHNTRHTIKAKEQQAQSTAKNGPEEITTQSIAQDGPEQPAQSTAQVGPTVRSTQSTAKRGPKVQTIQSITQAGPEQQPTQSTALGGPKDRSSKRTAQDGSTSYGNESRTCTPPSPDAAPPFTPATQSTTGSNELGPIMSSDLRTDQQTHTPAHREGLRAALLKKTLTDFYPAHNKICTLPDSYKAIQQNMQQALNPKDTTLKKISS